jgi:hypothetical protein
MDILGRSFIAERPFLVISAGMNISYLPVKITGQVVSILQTK